jgi:hypothetical protein
MTESKSSARLKSYLQAFLASLAILAVNLVIISQLLLPVSLTGYRFILAFGLLISPSMVLYAHILYKALVPITGNMPFTRFQQWLVLWPFIVTFIVMWALLAFLFDTFTPALPRDYRQSYLPVLVMVTITIILSVTRLRYPLARFLNKVFGTEAIANA